MSQREHRIEESDEDNNTTHLPTVGMRVLGATVGTADGLKVGLEVLGRGVGGCEVGLMVARMVGRAVLGTVGGVEHGHSLGTCMPLEVVS